MEFPHLGQNCMHTSCNKLDFLPVKCDACKKMYCTDHFSYTAHDCPEVYSKDVQVPLCPLCGAPVPGNRGDVPDVAVGLHIDNDCQADRAKERRKKVFTNKCSYKRCKTKEMISLICSECQLNYCLKHRHTNDHACEGRLAAKRRMAAEAAMARLNQQNTRRCNVADIQGNMTEDEALAHALALSLENQSTLESQDNNLARTLMNRQRVGGETSNRCSLS